MSAIQIQNEPRVLSCPCFEVKLSTAVRVTMVVLSLILITGSLATYFRGMHPALYFTLGIAGVATLVSTAIVSCIKARRDDSREKEIHKMLLDWARHYPIYKCNLSDADLKKYVNVTAPNGMTLFILAALYKQTDICKKLRDLGADLNVHVKGENPLHIALNPPGAPNDRNNYLKHIKCLVEDFNFDLNKISDNGTTPLDVAEGHLSNLGVAVVNYLSQKGAYSARHKDKVRDLFNWVREPVRSKINPSDTDLETFINATDHNGDTLFHKAAAYNQLAVCKKLITLGANAKALANGQNALHCALSLEAGSYQDWHALITWLVEEQKIEINKMDDKGQTPLDFLDELSPIDRDLVAQIRNDLVIQGARSGKEVSIILNNLFEWARNPVFKNTLSEDELRLFANSRDNQGRTLFHVAAFNNRADICLQLCAAGADVWATAKGKNALHYALLAPAKDRMEQQNFIKLLVEGYQLEINQIDNEGQTPLDTIDAHIGSDKRIGHEESDRQSDREIREYLISKGAKHARELLQ